VVAVRAAASRLGLELETRQFPQGTRTAEDAARAIGVQVGQIVKSLVFAVDGVPVMALMSGANQLDETRLAAAAGGQQAARVDAETVRTATGFPVGGAGGQRTGVSSPKRLSATSKQVPPSSLDAGGG
jgi:prolyl-tRNA editing enzyme YbaK/EbsC (Cys-tRNA(Pro) deacylase)